MSAFSGLLAGIGSGIGDVYTKEGEAKRNNQRRQNELLADSIGKRLETDDTLTDEDALNLHAQELKLRGVPDKDIQDILQHSKYHARMHADQMNRASQPQGPGLDSPAVPDRTIQAPVVHVPGQAQPDQGPAQTIPGVAAGAGVGPSLPPMPEYKPKTQGDYRTAEAAKLDAAKYGAMYGAQQADTAQRMIDVSKYNREANLQLMKDLKGEGGHYKIGVSATGGQTINPDVGVAMQGMYFGKEIPSARGPNGEPLNADKLHHIVRYSDGTIVGYETPGDIKPGVEVDQDSPTHLSKVFRDKTGAEVDRVKGAAYDSRLSDVIQNRQQLTDLVVDGHIVKAAVPITSTTSHPVPGVNAPGASTGGGLPPMPQGPGVGAVQAPGQTASPAAPAATGPATPASQIPSMPVRPKTAAAAPTARAGGVRILGTSPAEQKMLDQNQLTAPAQKDVRDTQTTLDIVDRVENAIKDGIASGRIKKDQPLTEFLPMLAYSAGFNGDQSALLSALSMGRIIEAGRITHPTGSRAISLLNKAMIHTPDAWKDSGGLMIDKLETIKHQLNDYIDETYQYNSKFPGIPGNNGRRPAGTTGAVDRNGGNQSSSPSSLPDGGGKKVTSDVVKAALAAVGGNRASALKALKDAHWDTN